MKRFPTAALCMFLALLPLADPAVEANEPSGERQAVSDLDLPFVYTDWQQYTVGDGLPNDHIFAVEVDGPWVWIGTEDGLARLDKRSGEIRSWKEEDGLPWRVVSALAANPDTGEVWLGMFGGGLARFSGGRFDHFHQLNSGLVNDVVYGVCIENENVWAATTAGASRYNTRTGEWTIYTEKNAPMEEIWCYSVDAADGKVYAAVWGGGILEWDTASRRWNAHRDPDREMEIDLYRDDGIVHVITTGVSYVDQTLWVTTYFGASRYDGRHWRGYFKKDSGAPSDFHNAVQARSANEAWFSTDKGLGQVADFPTDTWVVYTTDHASQTGQAVITRGDRVLENRTIPPNIPHNYVLWTEIDGDDLWVGTSKGLAHARGEGFFPGLRRASDRNSTQQPEGQETNRGGS
jgi:ligand-binding sensor domain-containing protein